MSAASDRGKLYERRIRKITAKALKLDVKRDSRSGAGELHKQDIRDRYGELPIFIECKDQEALSVKKEWRVTDGKSSYGQAPLVVFPDAEEDLVVMRYTDLLNFIREARDWQETAENLRKPPLEALSEAIDRKKSLSDINLGTCREGHLAPSDGYCLQKGCKWSRGYKAKKEKK